MQSLAGITTIFLDDGGVLNDNRLRAPQWARLVGEYFAPRLGGTPERWAAANPAVVKRMWEGAFGPPGSTQFASHREWSSAYYRTWLLGMCEGAGVVPPPDHRIEPMARDADDYITRRVISGIPGAAEAVRTLRSAGVTLHMGSGGESRQLANYLEVMAIRDCFGTLYGADLVDVPKDRPEYHRRVLEDSGVSPETALFVDNSPEPLQWAAALGAKTALIGEHGDGRFTFLAASLAELVSQLLAAH